MNSEENKDGESVKKLDILDIQKMRDEEKDEGYNIIHTGKLGMKDRNVVEAYGGLGKIEESFKTIKIQL